MGSLLSADMASLFIKSLEAERFVRIMGKGSSLFRFVDDVLVVMRYKTLIQIVDVEQCEQTHPVYCGRRSGWVSSKLRFSVYRKPTSKNEYIHFLSRHY